MTVSNKQDFVCDRAMHKSTLRVYSCVCSSEVEVEDVAVFELQVGGREAEPHAAPVEVEVRAACFERGAQLLPQSMRAGAHPKRSLKHVAQFLSLNARAINGLY